MKGIEFSNDFPRPGIVRIRVFGTDKPRRLQPDRIPGLYGAFGEIENRFKGNVLLMKRVY